MSEEYLVIDEIAERYRTSTATVRYWVHIGYGPKSIKVGRRRLWPLEEVERFDAELTGGAPGETVMPTAATAAAPSLSPAGDP